MLKQRDQTPVLRRERATVLYKSRRTQDASLFLCVTEKENTMTIKPGYASNFKRPLNFSNVDRFTKCVSQNWQNTANMCPVPTAVEVNLWLDARQVK